LKLALAVAAIVEGKDIQADLVQGSKGVDRVAEVTILAVQVKDGEAGVSVARCGRDPPAFEALLAGFRSGEGYRIEGQACTGRGAGNG
jgi:hypothetical protein